MSSSGRRQDSSWQYFNKTVIPGVTGCKATCKSCNKTMQGIVSRMKDHLSKCIAFAREESSSLIPTPRDPAMPPEGIVERMKRTFSQMNADDDPSFSSSIQSPAKKMKTTSLSNYVHTTTASEKKALDLQVAKMIYATNSPFMFIEHPEVLKTFKMLRPGYEPPSRLDIGNALLEEAYTQAYSGCKEKVEGKLVSMEMDGWSNIHNEPVVCTSISTYDGDTFLTSTIDTQDERHTGDNLEAIAESAIKKIEEELGCEVGSFVTDNASNMRKCRSQLSESRSVLTHPCSAHVADCLAKDIDNSDVKSEIVEIVKYFRRHHVPNALYKQKGGKKLQLPICVRWNSVHDCLQGYVDNWAVLVNVVDSHRSEIDSDICEKVLNIDLKRQAEEYLSKMKPLAVALDRLQANEYHLADAVVIWKDLAEKFEKSDDLPLADTLRLRARMSIALTPAHFLAYLLDPRYKDGTLLTTEEQESAMEFLSEYNPLAVPSVLSYIAKSKPFGSYMFAPEVLKKTDPLVWWKSQASLLDKNIMSLVEQLFTARASTSNIERIFSTFGLVHSKLRNRLQIQKAGKLVFLYKFLNM